MLYHLIINQPRKEKKMIRWRGAHAPQARMDPYEKKKIFEYLRTFMSATANRREYALKIAEWHKNFGCKYIDFKWLNDAENEKYDDFAEFSKKKKSEAARRIDDFYQRVINNPILQKSPKIGKLQYKINLFAQLLKLSDVEKDILEFYVRCKFNSAIENLKDTIFGARTNVNNLILYFLPYTEAQVGNSLNSDGKLRTCGILENEYDGDLFFSGEACQLFSQKFSSIGELRKLISGPQLASELQWSDFDHIKGRDFCAKLLKNAARTKNKGINILLYGPPGTGKTEFAKVVCNHIGVELYAAAEKSDDKHYRRITPLNMLYNVFGDSKGVCLLIDEADNLKYEDKITINRILENNRVPCIWIVNSIRFWEKSYLRRFSFAMDFQKPDLQVRTQIWQRTFCRHNIIIAKEQVAELAQEYNLPPSFIATAAKSAKMVRGGVEEIKQSLDALEKAFNNGSDLPKCTSKSAFDAPNTVVFNPALLNTDTDLQKFTERVKNIECRNFSLCLYGASGTGKSAYAEFLAEQLKMPVLKKKCSDLLSKYVGECEENIAAAFNEAKEKSALLIFDEADSFLQNRQHAVRSWEITQVNEMLTQMEKHPLPFVCTTNLMESIDKACLRRFTFKVEYRYMTAEQNSLAFEHFFGVKNVDLSHIKSLTPADFAVVRQKAEILGLLHNHDELLKMLEAEQKQKTPVTRRIGFC